MNFTFVECNEWRPTPGLRCYSWSVLSSMLKEPQEVAPVVIEGADNALEVLGADTIREIVYEIINDEVFSFDEDRYVVEYQDMTITIWYDLLEFTNRIRLLFVID